MEHAAANDVFELERDLSAVLGIVLNGLNVSVITFQWNLEDRYFPHWMEFAVTISIVTVGLLTFRWIVNRMPVLYDHPMYPAEH